MAGNILLEVVTPDRAVVSEEVQIVVAPGLVGEFGVLPGHTPFLASLKPGVLRYKGSGGEERIFVSSGFAETLPDKVTVLVDAAERKVDIDVARAKAAMERAQKRLAGQAAEKETIDAARARAALERAFYRLRLAQS